MARTSKFTDAAFRKYQDDYMKKASRIEDGAIKPMFTTKAEWIDGIKNLKERQKQYEEATGTKLHAQSIQQWSSELAENQVTGASKRQRQMGVERFMELHPDATKGKAFQGLYYHTGEFGNFYQEWKTDKALEWGYMGDEEKAQAQKEFYADPKNRRQQFDFQQWLRQQYAKDFISGYYV